jgi:hypothetical protein
MSTATAPPLARQQLVYDAADHDAVGEYVVIALAPFRPDRRLTDVRLRIRAIEAARAPAGPPP